MKLKKEHIVVLSIVCLVAILSVLTVYFSFSQENKNPLQFYEDEELRQPIGTFLEPCVFRDMHQGWNNKTFWIRNNGEKAVEIAMFATALPKGWFITWGYTGEPIKPQETVKVTISIYAAYPISTILMFNVNFRYKVVS